MYPCIVILGQTASGKSQFALDLAKSIDAEIVCLDSTTVYRQFDIGTNKPTADDQAEVPHHLINCLNPDEPFSAFQFVQMADKAIDAIHAKGKIPIIVGGSYFYLRALQQGMYPVSVIPAETIEEIEREYFEDEAVNTAAMHRELTAADPDAAAKIHPNDKYRLLRSLAILRTTGKTPSTLKPEPVSASHGDRLWVKYAVLVSRHVLNQNIILRTEKMIQGKLVEEAKKIRDGHPTSRMLQSIGYAEACRFLDHKLTEKQLRNEIIEKTRQLAKRQMCWIRSDPEIRFIDSRDKDRVLLELNNLSQAIGQSLPMAANGGT